MKFTRLALLSLATTSSLRAEVDFAHQVAPILKEHCAKCHMEEAKKGGFSMNPRAALIEGSENGAVVEPGAADDSLLIESILSDDKTERMPPKGPRVPAD